MYGVVTYPVSGVQWSWWCANGLSQMLFSRMGNEIMLKVVWSIPTYVMSCFQLPFAICEDMRKIIADYWCCFKDGKSKMHLRSWEWLWSPKNMGRMRFRDMELFDQGMHGRRCWCLLTEPNSLCARVLKDRYFADGDFWNAPACHRSASYASCNILHGRQLVKKGVYGVLVTDHWKKHAR
jgi:hypothetical protein